MVYTLSVMAACNSMAGTGPSYFMRGNDYGTYTLSMMAACNNSMAGPWSVLSRMFGCWV